MPGSSAIPIERIGVQAFRVPTDLPESDGTLSWDATTLVVVSVAGGGEQGLGYTYAHEAAAVLIEDKLADVVRGMDASDTGACWRAMVDAIRNLGRPGLVSMAIAAVDVAVWDLKARCLGIPLASLIGPVRRRVAVYGSGGFTSYDHDQLTAQLCGWAEQGIGAVKMKVGRDPAEDPDRVAAARRALGDDVTLMVDANGAWRRKQALAMAGILAESNVTWLEEPVSSDDLEGLRLLRDRGPAGMAITAGEYGYDRFYFRRMLEAGTVDVLQADATRCAGITGFLEAAAVSAAHGVPLSAHTAPALHLPVCCAVQELMHIEYFHDHVRLERMAFDGCPQLVDGALEPDWSRPGLGLALRHHDLEPYRI